MKKKLLLSTLLIIQLVNGQNDGSLDTNFGTGFSPEGIALKSITSYGEINNGTGKFIITNSTNNIYIGSLIEKRSSYSSPLNNNPGFHICNSNGSTINDDTFSGSGYTEELFNMYSLSNGNILTLEYRYDNSNFVNHSDIRTRIYDSNGLPDDIYNNAVTINNGYNEALFSLIEISTGIFACGHFKEMEWSGSPQKPMIAKLNTNGTLNTSYGNNGYAVLEGFNNSSFIDITSNGTSLYVITNTNKVIKLNLDGTIDTTFGSNGTFNTNSFLIPNKIKVQSDGKILVSGTSNNNYSVFRLDQNGIIDTTFGTNGIFKTIVGSSPGNTCSDMEIMSNDKILLSGNLANNTGIGLLRLNPNGSLDTSFGTNGITISIFDYLSGFPDITDVIVNDMTLKSDGKILITGGGKGYAPDNKNHIILVQYNNTNEVLNSISFEAQNIKLYPNPVSNTLTITQQNIKNVTITDLTGKTVLKQSTNNKIIVSSLQKGIYIVTIETLDGKTETQKIIKE
ncbi:MAG: T9SS type A sorting domain-containing protein [Flavobacterium haoranii]